MHADYASCGDDCEIRFGEGFSETKYQMEARFGYNDTHPNHYQTGLLDSIRLRNGAFICKRDIRPTREVDMPGIDGIVICGKTGGQSFEQVRRPDFDTESCPEGTKACSTVTSLANTVCYPEDQHEANCPITEMVILDEGTGDSLKINSAYTVLEYRPYDSSKKYLAYSKTVKDNLPITSTRLERQPCLDPTKTSSRTSFFVTELDRKETCTND